ncbi:Origin recognition complex subunit 2 [Colletotrichum spinosum]|uniref:Origin recognition complex subunit 2 n=1 Tax=Colletotrichum spinosum TaxID=1347390 RepID=A0A4R8Q7X5_9PEZI|nr:Origin recognition complex subunit 2 [Colletotrichum spinosum]
MVRRKAQNDDVEDSPARKRSRRDQVDEEPVNGTPSKRRRTTRTQDPYEIPSDNEDEDEEVAEPEPGPEEEEKVTPRKKRGRPPKSATPHANGTVTPSKNRRIDALRTPTKALTPRRRQAADRSARRKSARALIQSVVDDHDSEADEEGLAREIYESSEDEDEELAEERLTEPLQALDVPEPDTPSATPSRRRGRPPKTPTRARSPTPPRDLAPYELYFEHNKPGRAKTSHNTLSSLDLLTHDEYFSLLRARTDPHAEDLAYLQSLHESSFDQWRFELTQGFSLCLFGQGSKRALATNFATHLYKLDPEEPIVVANGHIRTLTPRDVFTAVAAAISPSLRLPAQPAAMLHSLSAALTPHPRLVTVILNSIDAPPLRRPAAQQLLAQLAAHPRVRLVATADTPSFPLLWDAAQRAAFNFLFHDCTTLRPLDVELDAVDDVHDLLGRKARRINGKDGVIFVLRSLPENAKNLFRLLVTEVLVAMDDDGQQQEHHGFAAETPGVEYRMLYNKAVEEFICSSEMAFRTLLKEFHDHQIITSRKDALGTELLGVPFRREELEAILEDLMS